MKRNLAATVVMALAVNAAVLLALPLLGGAIETALPERPHGVSIITPPPVTEQIVREAIDLGIEHVWMQPGTESAAAIELAQRAGISVLADGPCVLVALRFRDT